jgi:demethylmenaquinone methyltransferase / 2-methoxy-6-polyprenyl-1,4-benzoquinol methylase
MMTPFRRTRNRIGIEVTTASVPLTDKTPKKIAGMFDQIAGRYDLLNTVLSGGMDRYWRARAVRSLALTGRERALDLCTGTADVALALAKRGRAKSVAGIDFSGEMLRLGREKVQKAQGRAPIGLTRGDAMRLPLPSSSVDTVTVAFGIRNVQEPAVACREMARVLAPGGRLAILEFSMPRTPVVREVYQFYFRHILPRIGRLVSNHQEAYSYLPESVGVWATPETFADVLRDSGFSDVRATPMTFGTVYLYTATKR